MTITLVHMHIESAIRSDDDVVWRWVLARLQGDVESLAEDFLAELSQRGTYHHGLIPQEDLRSAAVETFRALITILMNAEEGDGTPDDGAGETATREDEAASIAQDLGRRRARSQVPVDSLIEAVRLDFVVLWRRIRAHAPADRPHLLVNRTERVLWAVETYIGEVQRAFLVETARIEQNSQLTAQRVLHLLLEDGPLDEQTLDRIGHGLGVSSTDAFEVAVSHADTATELQDRLSPWLHRGEVWGHRRHRVFCALRTTTGSGPSLAELAGGIGCLHVPGLHGLAAVRSAARGAERLMRAVPTVDGPQPFQSLWAFGAAVYLKELSGEFLQPFVEGLDNLAPVERESTVQAVRVYLDCGSIKRTAELLFCHRNTVVNRLRTFRAATGLDATTPRDAALALVALASMAGSTTEHS